MQTEQLTLELINNNENLQDLEQVESDFWLVTKRNKNEKNNQTY